jgi:uncharacterized protein (TIGR02265 family)
MVGPVLSFDPGSRIHERYLVEALIGSGATGKVYRAVDTRLARPVAVKVLDLVDADDTPRATAAALREARAGAAIHHVNVAGIYDVDEVDGRPFIVMELVSGASLRAYIARPTPLDLRLRWLADVAAALDAAHRLDVVHRDVKPENIIVGDDGRVKVLDFGIARRPHAAAMELSFGEEGGTLGTPAYLSPEQIRGEPLDARADQFSWGTVAYELLTGALPWKSSDRPLTLLASILRDTPAPFAPELGIPAEVEAVVLRALAMVPGDRFPSMGEVDAALKPFAAPPLLFPGMPAVPDTGRAASSPPSPITVPPRPASSTPAVAVDPLEETMVAPGPGLRDPDFAAPVDIEQRIALLPRGATCKGLVFQDLLRRGTAVRPASELFKLAGVPERRYVTFRDYPMEENLRLLAAVAGVVHRGAPLGEGLRRIGHNAFDMVLGTHVGRTMLGIFGRDLESVLVNGMKVYGILMSFGAFSCTRASPGRFLLRFRDYPAFVDTYEVGAAEGVLRHCGKRGRLRVAMDRLDDVTVEIEVV